MATEALYNAALARTYGYNTAGWLTSISGPYYSETISYTGAGYGGDVHYNGLIASVQTTLDFVGQPTPPSYKYSYRYDKLGRLTVADNSAINDWDIGVTAPTTYDANGNILSMVQGSTALTYVYTASTNKLVRTTGTGTQYTYDGNGNVLTSPTGIGATFAYDLFFGLPTRGTRSSPSTVDFHYGGSGQRVFKQFNVSGQVDKTQYLYGGRDYPLVVLFDDAAAAEEVRQYVYGPTGLIAQRFGTGSWQWVWKDHLGSTRVVETSGNGFSGVVAYFDYDPYGRVMRQSTGGSVAYRYTGQEMDTEFGLHNYRAQLLPGSTPTTSA